MPLRTLLSQHTVKSLPLPEVLVTLDVVLTAGQAFKTLMDQHLLSAPVVKDGKGVGMIDMADFVSYIVDLVGTKRPSEAELETLNKKLSTAPVSELINCSGTNPWETYSIDAPLLPLVEKLASGVRRVALVDAAGRVLNVVTQSTVLKFIHAHASAELGPLLKQTAHELNFTQGVLTVSEETPALEAFRQMAHSKLGSVAVVDETGSVVTNLSLSDIKNVAYEGTLACLYLPSISFVSALRQRSTREMSPSISVRETTPLDTIIGKLAATRVHRLFVVNGEHIPVGVVSLTDICRVALQ